MWNKMFPMETLNPLQKMTSVRCPRDAIHDFDVSRPRKIKIWTGVKEGYGDHQECHNLPLQMKARRVRLVQPRKMKVDRGYGFHLKISGRETAGREKNYLNLSVTKLSLEIRCKLLAIKTSRGEDSLPMGTDGTRKAQALLRCKFDWEETL